jgi:hypothetical protein
MTTMNIATELAEDALWNRCQHVLRDHRFELDQINRRTGTIVTVPETSQQYFEPWRDDAVTRYDRFEANLNTIRRYAIVTVEPTGRWPAEPTITVEVRKERYSLPERQFNASAEAQRVFSDHLPTMTGQPADQSGYWYDIGRDAAMEARLLGLIKP